MPFFPARSGRPSSRPAWTTRRRDVRLAGAVRAPRAAGGTRLVLCHAGVRREQLHVGRAHHGSGRHADLLNARGGDGHAQRAAWSSSTAPTKAKAATAAVSALKMRGPSDMPETTRQGHQGLPLALVEAALRPDDDPDCRVAAQLRQGSHRIGDVGILVAENHPAVRFPGRQDSVELSEARTSGIVRMPHCSAASTALARMRSSFTRAAWVRRVITGCRHPAPISTAFCTM